MKEEKEKKQGIIGMELGGMRFQVKEGNSVLGFISGDGVFFPNDEKAFSAEVLKLIAEKCELVHTAMESLNGRPPTR